MRIRSLLTIIIVAVAIMFSSGAAQAVDNSALIAQLQAQIVSLTAQLQALQAQQQGGQTWCHTFSSYLIVGSTNGEVSYLQTALTKNGLDVSGDASGIFGENTAAAVVQFQGKYGIRQTGTVGPLTRAKLNSLYGCTSTPAPTPTPTPTPAPTPTPSPTPTPNGIILFYGQGCPHCVNVDNYIATNNITQKVNFTKLETWYNQGNAALLQQKATACGLSANSIGVPLLWDGSRCYVGETDVINFFSKYVSTQQSCTPNWQCVWGPCVNGSQIETAVDSNSCGATTGQIICPTLAQTCSSSTQPSITITSPQGGEKWKIGETHNITWISSGFYNNNGKNNIGIDLISDSGIDYLVGISNSFAGVYSWTLSSASIMSANNATLSPGIYRIKIYDNETPALTQSTSATSNYFSIVAPTTSLNVSQDNLASISDAVAKVAAEIQAMLNR